MNQPLNSEAERALADIAERHGLSEAAVRAMLVSLRAGGGTMAQFSIPELGGSGQWMRGGMTMVGNMFDNALKARVDALCNELVQLLSTTDVFPAEAFPAAAVAPTSSGGWWPADLGVPSSTGGQNDAGYAVFPGTRRLAIRLGGSTRIFDTGEHQIGGVQQQQGGAAGSVRFTSQLGTFDVSSLREISPPPSPAAPQPPVAAQPPGPPHLSPAAQPQAAVSAVPSGDPAVIVAAIESLAGLRDRGILSEEEFTAKKSELLGRL